MRFVTRTGVKILLYLAGREFKPGDRIPMAHMAKCLGLRPRMVRRSMARLVAAGLVDTRHATMLVEPDGEDHGLYRSATFLRALRVVVKPHGRAAKRRNWHNDFSHEWAAIPFDLYAPRDDFDAWCATAKPHGRPRKSGKYSIFGEGKLLAPADFSFLRKACPPNNQLKTLITNEDIEQAKILSHENVSIAHGFRICNPITDSCKQVQVLSGDSHSTIIPQGGIYASGKPLGLLSFLYRERESEIKPLANRPKRSDADDMDTRAADWEYRPNTAIEYDAPSVLGGMTLQEFVGLPKPPPRPPVHPYNPRSMRMPRVDNWRHSFVGPKLDPTLSDRALLLRTALSIRHAWLAFDEHHPNARFFYSSETMQANKRVTTSLLRFARKCIEHDVEPTGWVYHRLRSLYKLRDDGYYADSPAWRGQTPSINLMLGRNCIGDESTAFWKRYKRWRRHGMHVKHWATSQNKVMHEQMMRWAELRNVIYGRDWDSSLPASYVTKRKREMARGALHPAQNYPSVDPPEYPEFFLVDKEAQEL